MDFGKVAYTKVVELERKNSSPKTSQLGSVYESKTIENLVVGSGEYRIDFGVLSIDGSACFILRGEIVAYSDCQMTVFLQAGDDLIYEKTYSAIAGEVINIDTVKAFNSSLNQDGVNVSLLLMTTDYAEFEIKSMNMVGINASGKSHNEDIDRLEMRCVKTPDDTFIVSYTKDGFLYATEVNPNESIELNFIEIFDGVIGHSFVFDKKGDFYLFYITLDKMLYKRKIGSPEVDELLSYDSQHVYACVAPENSLSDMVVCFSENNKNNIKFASYSNEIISTKHDLVLPVKSEVEDISVISTSDFVYIVVTNDRYDNYIFKSAYEPLGKPIIDTIKAGFELSVKAYNTLALLAGENVETLAAVLTKSVESFFDYSKLLEENTNSHLNAKLDVGFEKYAIGGETKVYSIVIDKSNTSPSLACVYADDSVDFLPMQTIDNDDGTSKILTNGWEDRWPFNAIKPCALENGTFLGYLDKNDFTKYENGASVNSDATNSYIDVMIEIPKIYYAIKTVDNKITISITDRKVNDDYCCFAHVYDGIECDNIYISAYTGVPKLYNGSQTFFSASGVHHENTNTIKYSNYETYISNKADTYRYLNLDQMTLLECLFILAFKSISASASFSKGNTSSSAVSTNGYHDKSGMYAGSLINSIPNKFIGIENIFGNMWQRVEGIGIRSKPYQSTYEIRKRDPYSSVTLHKEGVGYEIEKNTTLNNVYGVKKYMVNPYGNNKYGFLPQDQSYNGNIGSLSTYYGDSVDFSTYKGLWWGGDCKWGEYSGMFCFRCDLGTTLSTHKHGFRLVYYNTGGV